MDRYDYTILVRRSNEDDAFVALVPDLPGCLAHGSTPQLALTHVYAAIDLWLDTAREIGDPIPEPRKSYQSDNHDRDVWMAVNRTSLDKIWNNGEDDVYIELLKTGEKHAK